MGFTEMDLAVNYNKSEERFEFLFQDYLDLFAELKRENRLNEFDSFPNAFKVDLGGLTTSDVVNNLHELLGSDEWYVLLPSNRAIFLGGRGDKLTANRGRVYYKFTTSRNTCGVVKAPKPVDVLPYEQIMVLSKSLVEGVVKKIGSLLRSCVVSGRRSYIIVTRSDGSREYVVGSEYSFEHRHSDILFKAKVQGASDIVISILDIDFIHLRIKHDTESLTGGSVGTINISNQTVTGGGAIINAGIINSDMGVSGRVNSGGIVNVGVLNGNLNSDFTVTMDSKSVKPAKGVSPSDIARERIAVKKYFDSCVKNFKVQDFKDVSTLIDLSAYKNNGLRAAALMEKFDNVKTQSVYDNLLNFMRSFPEKFPDIESAVARRSKLQPTYMKDFVDIDYPDNGIDAQKAVILPLLESGAVEVSYIKKSSPTVETRLLTKNIGLVEKVYGKDWVVSRGSKKQKLAWLRQNIGKPDIEGVITGEMGLLKEFTEVQDVFASKGVSAGIDALEAYIESLPKRKFSDIPENITAFDISDVNDGSFYVTLSVENILSVRSKESEAF